MKINNGKNGPGKDMLNRWTETAAHHKTNWVIDQGSAPDEWQARRRDAVDDVVSPNLNHNFVPDLYHTISSLFASE
ncbi:hypothetical protein GWI33_013020 [Rhynchophorus ferrugineus]|uniref:Uncharacterized protein n=1 Tax=Rhynchophorus ferrugineus TaxID=354439 RepID=A0A834I5F0_RHYFE|nr:hypothetical protein GWI33_013020 [Rhynchophorus ferrugineus]